MAFKIISKFKSRVLYSVCFGIAFLSLLTCVSGVEVVNTVPSAVGFNWRDELDKRDDIRQQLIKERFSDEKIAISDWAPDMSDQHHAVLEQAYDLLGKKPNANVVVNGKSFMLDCIGTVAAVFYNAGIDITKDFHKYQGNGVSRFYHTVRDKNGIYSGKLPAVGDVVFWSNTWDSNGDGVFGNDPLTHVGIVTKVDQDGTIHYIHENYVTGIVVEQMNLFRPGVHRDEYGKIINSPMYINSSIYNKPDHAWLSGELWTSTGGFFAISAF